MSRSLDLAQPCQMINGYSPEGREIPDNGVTPLALFQRRLAALPLETYEAGETVITEGSRTGRLLILAKGKVAIVDNSSLGLRDDHERLAA